MGRKLGAELCSHWRYRDDDDDDVDIILTIFSIPYHASEICVLGKWSISLKIFVFVFPLMDGLNTTTFILSAVYYPFSGSELWKDSHSDCKQNKTEIEVKCCTIEQPQFQWMIVA